MKAINDFLGTQLNYMIYVDLDGVLSDWDKEISKLGFSHHRGNQSVDDSKMWATVAKKGISFWSEMEWMPDGKDLWQFVKKFKPTILTAHLQGNKDSINGKKIWIKRNLGYPKYIICMRKEKANYSNSSSILIDDNIKNITEWEEKGGIGILHKNAKESIRKLKGILKI